MSLSMQLFAHFFGDYILQAGDVATTKSTTSRICRYHVGLYLITFILMGASFSALCVVGVTHYLIDRYRLPKYLIYLKDHLLAFDIPKRPWRPMTDTGMSPETPIYLATWLFIITDNLIHIVINNLALHYL